MDHNFVACAHFDVKAHTMRFYNLDGAEMDIQDPKFFIDEDVLLEMQEAIQEMLNYYA